MSYTIIRSNGTTLPPIPDGNINTSSTSLGLPGRNYPGYGQVLDTNFVRLTENFASNTAPANPLRGQIWYNTNDNTLRVCPADGTTNAASWPAIATTASGGGQYTFGNITVTGNIQANNATLTNDLTVGGNIQAYSASISDHLTVDLANIVTCNIGTTRTQVITTGAATTTGTFTGTWTVTGPSSGNAISITQGSLGVSGTSGSSVGIKCDNYMYANGQPFTPSGTYTNSNVFNYLTGTGVTQFTGNIAPTKITTSTIAGGGNISGIWTLDSGSRIQATYADLAERFEADTTYDVGTVVELGGEKEITQVQEDLSDEVFGVVSTSAAFTMNGAAGNDDTHPAIAMSGRVPVKVIGKVKKGQRLVSAGRGYARAAKKDEMTAFNVIGRALEHKTTEGSGTVLAVVSITK